MIFLKMVLAFFTGAVFLTAVFFILLRTPLRLGLTVALLSFFVSIIIVLLMPSSWFSFLLLIVFLSGIMVLFVYVASLASNEIFTSSWAELLVIILGSVLIITIITYKNPFISSERGLDLNRINSYLVYKIYSSQLYSFTLLLITYLLVVLIVVVKNATIRESPLRSKK